MCGDSLILILIIVRSRVAIWYQKEEKASQLQGCIQRCFISSLVQPFSESLSMNLLDVEDPSY